MIFSVADFYWRDSDKKRTQEIVALFNTLSLEIQKAIRDYGASKYDEGSADGYESCAREHSDSY